VVCPLRVVKYDSETPLPPFPRADPSLGAAPDSRSELPASPRLVQDSIEQNRPVGAKGVYWKTMYVTSTMGPSVRVDISKLRAMEL